MHMAAVNVHGDWEPFEWEMAKVIVACRSLDGLNATWLARSEEDPAVAYLVTIWENQEKMAAHWKSDFYRVEIAPKLLPRAVGEIPNWSGPISSLYSRLPHRFYRRSRLGGRLP
jgi:quinol monooxygenase YgiN